MKLPITSCIDVPADLPPVYSGRSLFVLSHADQAGIEGSPVKTRQSEEHEAAQVNTRVNLILWLPKNHDGESMKCCYGVLSLSGFGTCDNLHL